MFMQSILVSTGENKNEDVFLPAEMWGARATPAYKPVDWEHNTGRELSAEEQQQNPGKVVVDNQTIGVMYNAYVVDDDNQVIDETKASASDFEIPANFHIVDEAVIWKGLYPKTAARIEQGAQEGNLFVSMEAWFTDYDYLVGDKVVARNEETAFLDTSLRANGGAGVFGNSRVRRVLRDITFGGKGIVARPANEPSVITSVTHEPMCASASHSEVIRNNILFDVRNTRASQPRRDLGMSTETKAQASVPLEQYTKAHDEAATLRAEAKASEGQLAQANEQIEDLKQQVKNITQAFTKGAAQLEGVLPGFASRVTQGNPENFFGLLAETLESDQKAKAELQSKLKAALEKVVKIEEDNRAASRLSRIDSVLANLDEDDRKAKKDKLAASVKSLSDDDFDSLLETLAELAPAQAAKPDFMKKKGEKDEEKDKDKKDKEAKAAALAERLGVSAEAVLEALEGPQEITDEENLAAVLGSVKASERTPPAGADGQQGVDLTQAFGGLVSSMLSAHKPQGNE
jgi:hypothetical protein